MAIKISPDELRSQADRMTSLQNSYDSLFVEVTGTLNSVNANWSEYLSNNFSGKIISAQKSFATILETLEVGAKSAHTSADTFADIDVILAKGLGLGVTKTIVGSDQTDDILEIMNAKYQALEEDYDGVIEKLDREAPIGTLLEVLWDDYITEVFPALGTIDHILMGSKHAIEIMSSEEVREAQEQNSWINTVCAYTNGILDAANEELVDEEVRYLFSGMEWAESMMANELGDGNIGKAAKYMGVAAVTGLTGIAAVTIKAAGATISTMSFGSRGALMFNAFWDVAKWETNNMIADNQVASVSGGGAR